MTLLTDLMTKFRNICPGIGRGGNKHGDREIIPRSTKGKEAFEKYWPEIELALSHGWSLNSIWEVLSEQKKIQCSYSNLARMVAECDKHSPLVARPGWIVHALVAYALGYADVAEYWRDIKKGSVIARDRKSIECLSSLINGFIDHKEEIVPNTEKLKSIFVIPGGNDEDMRLFLDSPESTKTDDLLLKKVRARARRISEFFALNGFPNRVCKGDETNETVATWFHLECTGGYDFPNYDPGKGDYLSFAKNAHLAQRLATVREAVEICKDDKYLSVVNQALKATPWIDRSQVQGCDRRLYRWEKWADKRSDVIRAYFTNEKKYDITEDNVFVAAAYHPAALIALWEEEVETIAKANPEKLTGMGSFLDAVRRFWHGDRAVNATTVDKWCKPIWPYLPKLDPETNPEPEPVKTPDWGNEFVNTITKAEMDQARFITKISKDVNLTYEEKTWMFMMRRQRIQALLYKYGFVYGMGHEEQFEQPAAKHDNAFVALLLESWFRVWLDEKTGCYTIKDMELFFKSVVSRYDECLERPSQEYLELVDEALKDTPYYDFSEEKPRQSRDNPL